MKKAILGLLLTGLFISSGTSQKLLEIYKNGPVKLTAEKNYGVKNNWESLFNLYYDTLTKNIGHEENKKIVVAPDGSVFMSHKNRYEIWKFGMDGNFLKKIGSRGGKPEQFSRIPSIYPVADGKYLIVSGDVSGRIKFFDLDGVFFKSYTFNYTTGNFQSFGKGEILFEGNIMLKSDKFLPPGSMELSNGWRHIIVKLNLYTGIQKTIYEFTGNGDSNFPNIKSIDSTKRTLPPPTKIYLPDYLLFKAPVFTILHDGRFLQSNRETGEVKLLNELGKEISHFKLDITPVAISEKDVIEHYEATKTALLITKEKASAMRDLPEDKVEGNTVTMHQSYPNKKEILARIEKSLTTIDRLKDKNAYFPFLPFFSNIIIDDEGNLLVFEFTNREDKNSNIFNVIAYDSNGKKLARTSFICDDYNLSFSESTFVISKGYVYAVAKLKNYQGMPLRLVKLKMTN